MPRPPSSRRAWSRPSRLVASLALGTAAVWAPIARACPACAAGDTSASVGDGWMVALLSLPISLGVAAALVAWRLAAAEDRKR